MTIALNKTRLGATMAALALLAGTVAGCSGADNADQGGGGVLRIGTSNGIDSMNPFVGINQDGYEIGRASCRERV